MVYGFYVGGASEFGKCAAKKTQRFIVKPKWSKTSIWTNILGNLTSRRNTTHFDVWILLALSPTQTHLDWCLNILSMTSLFLKHQAILHGIPPYLALRYLHINLPSNHPGLGCQTVNIRWWNLGLKKTTPILLGIATCRCVQSHHIRSWPHEELGGCDPKHWMVRVVLPRYRLHHPKMPHHFAESLGMRKWLPLKIHTKMKSNASITGQNISNPMMKTYSGLSLEGKMVKPAWNPSVNSVYKIAEWHHCVLKHLGKKQTPETCSWFFNHILIIDCIVVEIKYNMYIYI